jgi:hypothetical protein
MKVIYNPFIPFKGFSAINLFGLVFARRSCFPLTDKTLNHEKIHTEQMKELLYIGFYVWYAAEWIVGLALYGRKSYSNISFEREAYANDTNRSYLSGRARYSFFKYLKGGKK